MQLQKRKQSVNTGSFCSLQQLDLFEEQLCVTASFSSLLVLKHDNDTEFCLTSDFKLKGIIS